MARVLKKAVCVFDLALAVSGLGVGDQYIKSYFQLSDWIVLLIRRNFPKHRRLLTGSEPQLILKPTIVVT